MILNKFTLESLKSEFKFLHLFFEGQPGVTRNTCGNCKQVFGGIRQPEADWEDVIKCPKCGSYGWTAEQCSAHVRPHRGIEEVVIRKIDENFLRSTPQCYSWSGSAVDIDRGSEIRFVLKDEQAGFKITDQVQCESESGSNYAHEERYSQKGESVAHAIERIGIDPTRIVAVLEWQYGIRTTNHVSHGQRLIIWKVGKADPTIVTVINRLYSEAAEQVAAEADL